MPTLKEKDVNNQNVFISFHKVPKNSKKKHLPSPQTSSTSLVLKPRENKVPSKEKKEQHIICNFISFFVFDFKFYKIELCSVFICKIVHIFF